MKTLLRINGILLLLWNRLDLKNRRWVLCVSIMQILQAHRCLGSSKGLEIKNILIIHPKSIDPVVGEYKTLHTFKKISKDQFVQIILAIEPLYYLSLH